MLLAISSTLITHAEKNWIMCVFSVRHIAAFLCLGTLDCILVVCLGAILSSKIMNKNHKIMKNVALIIP